MLFQCGFPSFRLELDNNPSQRQVAHILRRVDHWRIEGGPIRNNFYEYLPLPVRPLLKPCAVELHHHALAMAVPGSGIANRQPFFENEEGLAVVANSVLLRRYDLGRRLYRRMIWFDVHFEV